MLRSVASLVLGPLAAGLGLGVCAPRLVARAAPLCPAAGVAATLLLVAGGAANSAALLLGARGAWRAGPAMRAPRCFLGLSCCADGALLAVGGGDSLFQGSAVRRETEVLRRPEAYGGGDSGDDDASGSDGGDGGDDGDASDDESDDESDDSGHRFRDDGGDDDDDDDGGGGSDDDNDDDDGGDGGGGGGGGARVTRPRAPDPPPSDDDPSRVWAPGPPLLEARCGLGAAVTADGRVYAVGGYGGGLTYHRSVEALATAGASDDGRGWARAPAMTTARTGLGVAAGPDACVYAVGGSPDGASSHRSAERLDPRVGAWERLPDMDHARGYCAAAFGASGVLVVHGGCDRDRPLRSAECFDPRAMRWLPIPAAGGAGPRRADHAIVYALAS